MTSTAPNAIDAGTHIENIEHGMPALVRIKGEDARFELADRMRELDVPGLSVALFDHGRLQWAHAWAMRMSRTRFR